MAILLCKEKNNTIQHNSNKWGGITEMKVMPHRIVRRHVRNGKEKN